MKNDLFLSIDFGNDTTKIAYSFKNGIRDVVGRIINSDSLFCLDLPSVARFNEDRWIFSDEVITTYDGTYKIVKIKEIMSLLIKPKGKNADKVFEKNKNYFYNDYQFPKFYFPKKILNFESYEDLIKNDHTFRANITPKELCVLYFEYIHKIIKKEILKLEKQYNFEFNIKLSIVHPLYSGKLYASELINIIEEAFKMKSSFNIDSTRGICSMAYLFNSFSGNENVLVFEIGDEKISVVKSRVVMLNNNPVFMIEGREGHLNPENIGGNDIDNAIASDIGKKVSNRISFGRQENDSETLSLTKQYLLADNIRKTKMLISTRKNIFDAPLIIPSDVLITEKYNGNDVKKVVGISNNSGIYSKILDYIEREISFDGNKNLTKIIISGGAIETYGLFDKLKDDIEEKYSIPVLSIDINKNLGIDHSNITSNCDSVYAASVGASLAFMKNFEMDTVLSLSYGSYLNYASGNPDKYFAFYVEKNTKVKSGQYVDGMYRFYFNEGRESTIPISAKMPIYSTYMTQAEIDSNYNDKIIVYKKFGNKKVFDISKPNLVTLKKHGIIKLVAGNETEYGYKITYKGKNVDDAFLRGFFNLRANQVAKFSIREYIAVTEEGRVYPFVEALHVEIDGSYKKERPIDGFEIKYAGLKPFEIE